MKRLSLALGLLLISAALAGCGVQVPDVRGMTVPQATAAVESAGFEVGRVEYDEEALGAAGAVVSQNPSAGERVKEGSLVLLTVAGPRPAEVPDLSGLDQDQAIATLRALGLDIGAAVESYDSSIAAGIVTSQTPSPGIEVPRGSSVDVVLSKGKQPVAIPTVVGKPQSDAINALSQFKVKVETQASPAAKGTVIAQNPAKGELQPGSPVTITVSTGVVMVSVPDVIGYFWREFEGQFEAVGLKAVLIEGEVDEFGDSYVIRQSPAAGSLVPKGSTVKLYMGVPDWDD